LLLAIAGCDWFFCSKGMLRVGRKCGLTINIKQWLARRVTNTIKTELVLNYGRNQIFTCNFLLKLWYGQIQDCWKPTTWIFEGLNTFETNWVIKGTPHRHTPIKTIYVIKFKYWYIYILQFKTRTSVSSVKLQRLKKLYVVFPCWQRSLFVLGTRRRRDLCLDPTLPQSVIVDESNQFVKQVLKPVLRNK
jgi:hypothetical protein